MPVILGISSRKSQKYTENGTFLIMYLKKSWYAYGASANCGFLVKRIVDLWQTLLLLHTNLYTFCFYKIEDNAKTITAYKYSSTQKSDP